MDIYMSRQEFLLKFHPKTPKNGGMLPLNHPELFITDKIQTHRYPENFQQQVPSQVSFRSELLITNEAHDGLWLFVRSSHGSLHTRYLFLPYQRRYEPHKANHRVYPHGLQTEQRLSLHESHGKSRWCCLYPGI